MKWLACLVLLASASLCAQLPIRSPGLNGIHPQLTVGNNLTVSCSPGSVSFTLVRGGAAAGSAPIAITTTWGGVSLVSSLHLYAYFNSASAALSGGTPVSNIPSSVVYGQVTTGLPTSFTPFTQTNPFGAAGASLHLVQTGSLISLGGTRTDNLNLKIDLTTLLQQPAAVYHGTLYIVAQEF